MERPILFSSPMILAILAGRKTQTRRIVKPKAKACPYGRAGDRLWVRETFCHQYPHEGAPDRKYVYRADGEDVYGLDRNGHAIVDSKGRFKTTWIPSIHMTRAASRITLDVVDVGTEAVYDMSEEDVRAEGFDSREAFFDLFFNVNRRAPQGSNPMVWVVKFRRAA